MAARACIVSHMRYRAQIRPIANANLRLSCKRPSSHAASSRSGAPRGERSARLSPLVLSSRGARSALLSMPLARKHALPLP